MKDEKNLGFHKIQVLVLSVEKNDVRMNVVFHPSAFILHPLHLFRSRHQEMTQQPHRPAG